MKEVMQHLVRGWGGLANILFKATEEGYRLPDDEFTLLQKMHRDMEAVVLKQTKLRDRPKE